MRRHTPSIQISGTRLVISLDADDFRLSLSIISDSGRTRLAIRPYRVRRYVRRRFVGA